MTSIGSFGFLSACAGTDGLGEASGGLGAVADDVPNATIEHSAAPEQSPEPDLRQAQAEYEATSWSERGISEEEEAVTTYKAVNTGKKTGDMCLNMDAVRTMVHGSRSTSDLGPFYGNGSSDFDECHTQGSAYNSDGDHTMITCQSKCGKKAYAVHYRGTGHRKDMYTFDDGETQSPIKSTVTIRHPSSTQFRYNYFPVFLANEDDSGGEWGSRLFMMAYNTSTDEILKMASRTVKDTASPQPNPHIGTAGYTTSPSGVRVILGCDYNCRNLYKYVYDPGEKKLLTDGGTKGNWVVMRKYNSSKDSWDKGPGDVSAASSSFTPKKWDSYQSLNIFPDCNGGAPYVVGAKSHRGGVTEAGLMDQTLHVWRITSGLDVPGKELRLKNVAYLEWDSGWNDYLHEGLSLMPTGTDQKIKLRGFPNDYDGNCYFDSCCADDTAGHIWGFVTTID